MLESLNDSDKWITMSNKGWVVFIFDKPIIIRGYGVISANDMPKRDPGIFEFSIIDAVAVNKPGTNINEWQVVSKKQDIVWPERHHLIDFYLIGG
jgi:hypothetical protein